MTTTPSPAGTIPEDETPDIVRVTDVSKRFVIRKDNSLKERLVAFGRGRQHREEFWALRDVSINIRAGHTVALIGHNGSGKSTLLKVIGGIIDPTSGSVARRGRIAALLELGAGFHPDLTGRENVYLNASILGLSREDTEERFDEILSFSGIGDFIDTQVKFYSSGMYVRLAFAVAVHTDPDLLLVDEVLAVGDEAFQRKCLDKIRSFQEEGRTIILVTHNLSQVTELADRTILLNRGEVVYDGEPGEAVTEFRNILEGRRVVEAEAEAAVQSAKQGEAVVVEHGRVIGARAWAEGRDPADPVQPGDDLRIEVTLEHDEGIDDWMCAIQIDNTLGQPVYGTTTARIGANLGRLHGSRTVGFILRDARFGAGKYFINASLMDRAGRHLSDRPQATSFDVPYYPLAVGTVHAVPEVVETAV
ncbi:ABC transporter ATP-binding protein [Leifsonia sp. ZF2019]|uniref:ABC transporter ATP-binding protein n=1 Tax=Leifsonia sp. ZF2019 TaxID=2781978 RepID=UPI001CBE14B4|nr:ABC transporter ATP-binding protein [Leifsonia sp. ZF2019]UAJ80555.1 ABC transporter ATP-binding protein [Leifsonia sp. ZF2019]